jgi:RimJ/RimL family protein N-acetyltransferase
MTVPLLETPRLILREYRHADYRHVRAMWANPRTTRDFEAYVFDEEMCWLRFLRNWGQWATMGFGYWAIEDRAGAFAGTAGFMAAHRDVDLPYADLPEAGWVLAPSHHGQGLGLEAMTAALAWADAHLDAPATWCMIAPRNLASQKLGVRLGYEPGPDCVYRGHRVLTYQRPRRVIS